MTALQAQNARTAEDVAAARKYTASELGRVTVTLAELSRFAEAHALAQAENTRLLGEISKDTGVLKAQNSSLKEALDKGVKEGYAGNRTPVIETDKASAESLKQEIEEMHKSVKALMVCLAVFTASWCDAEASTSQSLPSKVVAVAPAVESPDMWTRHPEFFSRFREVWVNCPGRGFEKGTYIESAKVLNEYPAVYHKIITTCPKHEAHGRKRIWPPNPQTNTSLQDRFFEWDERTSSWVRK